jgi:cell division protease FtsH
MIDEEVRKIIDIAYVRTKALLSSKKAELINLAQELLKKEILFQYDLEALIGKRPFDHKTNYENYMESDSTKKDDVVVPVVENNTTNTFVEPTQTPENSATADDQSA